MKKKTIATMAMAICLTVVATGCGDKKVESTKAPETTNYTEFAEATEEATQEVEATAAQETDAPKPTETPVEKSEKKSVYFANEKAENMDSEPIEEEITPQKLVELLAKHDILTEKTKVNNMTEVDGKNGKELSVDFSQEFQDQLFQQGTTGEFLMMGSVVNTFLQAFEAKTMTITVNGQAVESGHCVYDQPMSFYQADENSSEEEVFEGLSKALGIE